MRTQADNTRVNSRLGACARSSGTGIGLAQWWVGTAKGAVVTAWEQARGVAR